ncbi:MAG: hypothetical protein Q7S43_01800 [bacterium]|nr:hypothetical protein [bacterium]
MNQEEMKNLMSLFQELGFKDVHVKKASLPQHIFNWIQEEDEDEGQEISEMGSYFHVDTAQGSFGLFTAGILPVIDVEGTGITPQDIGYEAGCPRWLLSVGEERDILKFRDLLEAKSKNT